MKKNFYKLVKLVCVSAILLACVSCADQTKEQPDPKPQPDEKDFIIGTWFWNYGYNQDLFVKDLVTFYEDGMIDIIHESQKEVEYDKGTYSIIQDKKYGKTLLLNLTKYKDNKGDTWEDTDAKMYFAIETLTDDRFIFYRFRRDFSAMGYGVFEFDPPWINDFSKVKNGTKQNLAGKWKFNKRGTPDADWEETWTFNADGTMESKWEETGSTNYYKGEYQVIEKNGKSVLYQKLTKESADGTTFTDRAQPMEFWYDYFIDNENVINVNCTKDKIDGVEHPQNPPIENFYYRVLELEEVTYHWTNYTFKDYYPKGQKYDLLTTGNWDFFTGVPSNLYYQKFNDWYDNQSLNGNPIKSIAANDNSGNHEYWVNWGLKCNKNLYDPENGNYNHEFTLPVKVFVADMDLPEKGDTVRVSFSGKASEDLNFFWGLRIADNSEAADGWKVLGQDWHTITSTNKQFTDSFEIEIQEAPATTDIDNICFNLCYNPDEFDKPITIEDFSFTVTVEKQQ